MRLVAADTLKLRGRNLRLIVGVLAFCSIAVALVAPLVVAKPSVDTDRYRNRKIAILVST